MDGIQHILLFLKKDVYENIGILIKVFFVQTSELYGFIEKYKIKTEYLKKTIKIELVGQQAEVLEIFLIKILNNKCF